MGNIFTCFMFRKRFRRSLKKSKKKTVNSLVDQQNALISSTTKIAFNWSSMQNVLLEINTNVYSSKITRQDIIAADKMLCYIDQDIAYHCKTLLDRLTATRRTYLQEFEEHANSFRIVSRNKDNVLKCLLHNFHMIHLHKKILNALQFEGNPFEILDLLALSHAVMKVTTSDFKLMNVVFCKYLTTLEIESEITIRPLIQYLNVVTNYVCNAMEKCRKRENMVEDIVSKDQCTVSNARKNYRQLKKWQNVVASVRNECANLHKESLSNLSLIKNNSEEILIATVEY